MEQLLKQAQDLVSSIQDEKARAKKLADDLEIGVNKTSKLQNELIAQKADLDAREAAIAAQEEPAKILAEAKAAKAANQEVLDATKAAQADFQKERASFNKYLSEEKAKLQTDKDIVAKELATLKADRKQLEEAKKNYKDEILNNLKAVA